MLSSTLSKILSPLVVNMRGSRVQRRLMKTIDSLPQSQEEFLLSVIRENENTDFGRDYGFKDIHSIKDFQTKIPVLNYEKLRPYIMKQDELGHPALLARDPVFYAVTSGTTGKPKYIPVHEKALLDHKASTNLFVYNLQKARPKVLSGKILGIVSPAEEGRMEGSGLPFGSTSGHMYAGLPSFVKKKYVIPAEIFEIADYDLKYFCILLLALAEKNVTYLSTANPSTIAKLATMVNERLNELLTTLRTGVLEAEDKLPQHIKTAFYSRFKANPARAQRLQKVFDEQGALRLQDLWPNLQATTTWTGGSCAIFLDQLKGQFADQTLIRDLGYLSSEFRGSVPLQSGTNAGVPTILSGFYEFAEQEKRDSGEREFLLVNELEDQKKYYIFVTTAYGLYRYEMNDIVQVDGFYNGKLPMIRFVQKGKGVTSITGEKLYENQVIQAVHQVEKEMGVESQFFILSCEPELARYSLYYQLSPSVVENKLMTKGVGALEECRRFEKRVDEVLMEINIEYEAKRKSGRVKPLRACVLKRGSYDAYKAFCLERGQREGQFKIVALQYAKDIAFDFSPLIRWDGALSDQENMDLLAHTRHVASLGIGGQGIGSQEVEARG